MKSTTITLAVISLILLIVAFFTGGMDLVTEGLIASSVTAYRALLLIFAAFLVIGQLQTLITADMIKDWMQKYSGSKGILLSSLAGPGSWIDWRFFRCFWWNDHGFRPLCLLPDYRNYLCFRSRAWNNHSHAFRLDYAGFIKNTLRRRVFGTVV